MKSVDQITQKARNSGHRRGGE